MKKKHQHIFVILFLGSMFFSIIQYLPFQKDDVHASKTLAKKSTDPGSENDTADDNANDDESSSDEFLHENSSEHFCFVFSNTKYQPHKDNFRTITFSISTPPPKI